MGSIEKKIQMAMDFYKDIDIDFGEIGVGDAIRIFDGDSTKKSLPSEKRKPEIVFEDEVNEHEYEMYDPKKYDYATVDASFLDTAVTITREVSEATGNVLLNEPLERTYKERNCTPKGKSKSKSRKSANKPPASAKERILNKADLRKELGNDIGSSDGKVNFGPKRGTNALLKGLQQRSPMADAEAEVVKYGGEEKMEYVRNWVEKASLSSSDDDYYSLNNTSSSSYFSASEGTTPRPYRATSKRLSGNKGVGVTTSTPITDEMINFTSAAKVSSSNSKSAPKTKSPSAPPTPMKKKDNRELYVPGSYNREFRYKQDDFPAMRKNRKDYPVTGPGSLDFDNF